MSRSLPDLIRDFEDDPDNWEVAKVDVQPSTNKKNIGGSSVQEVLRNKSTGEEMVRHTILKPNGKPFAAPHFRPKWK